jgi:hypothetical protein
VGSFRTPPRIAGGGPTLPLWRTPIGPTHPKNLPLREEWFRPQEAQRLVRQADLLAEIQKGLASFGCVVALFGCLPGILLALIGGRLAWALYAWEQKLRGRAAVLLEVHENHQARYFGPKNSESSGAA